MSLTTTLSYNLYWPNTTGLIGETKKAYTLPVSSTPYTTTIPLLPTGNASIEIVAQPASALITVSGSSSSATSTASDMYTTAYTYVIYPDRSEGVAVDDIFSSAVLAYTTFTARRNESEYTSIATLQPEAKESLGLNGANPRMFAVRVPALADDSASAATATACHINPAATATAATSGAGRTRLLGAGLMGFAGLAAGFLAAF